MHINDQLKIAVERKASDLHPKESCRGGTEAGVMKTVEMAEVGLWHYTVVPHLLKILSCGEIHVATAGVGPGVKPAVWCSTNALWEETANKAAKTEHGIIIFDRRETHEHLGLARIAIRRDAAPHTWADYERLSNEDGVECRGLEQVARSMGAWPAQWRCSFAPISRVDWLETEAWDGVKWRLWSARRSGRDSDAYVKAEGV